MEENLLLEGKNESEGGPDLFPGRDTILPRWSQLIGEIGSEARGIRSLVVDKSGGKKPG